MKRITILAVTLAVAVVLPVLAFAQQGEVSSRYVPRNSSGSAYSFGAPGYDTVDMPTSGQRSGNRGFSQDFLQADVNLDVDVNPMSLCSGLDIRDSIKGMFNLSTLTDDVKNYLTSFMAKYSLSMVYGNPHIAGVLDGLKAFGNARFMAAQQSCEAIEGEVSEQSRFMRQQAFDACVKQNGKNNAALLKCSTESGYYIGAMKEFANKAESLANESLHNWISPINRAVAQFNTSTDREHFESRLCKNLGDWCNKPGIRDQAEQVDTLVPDVRQGADGKTKIAPSVVSYQEVLNRAVYNAQGSFGLFAGAMLAVAGAFDGNIDAAVRAIEILKAERKLAYQNAGTIMPDTAKNLFNRAASVKMFISAERRYTAAAIKDLQAQMVAAGYPLTPSEHPDIGNGNVGTHTAADSDHNHGLAGDFNCNTYSGGELSCLEEARRRARQIPGVRYVAIEPNSSGNGIHLHVSFYGPKNESTDIRNFAGSGFAEAVPYVAQINQAMDAVADLPDFKAKVDALRTALKEVPLVAEDACLFDIDARPGLDDIRNINEIFGLNSQVNAIVQQMGKPDSNGGGDAAAGARLVSSMAGKIEALDMTIGHLAQCIMVTSIESANLMKTQYLSRGELYDYLRSLSLATAGQASLTVYDAVIYQTNLARIQAATDRSAPPSLQTGFEASLEMLESMRKALKDTLERQDNLAARQRSLDSYLMRKQARGDLEADKRARSRSINAGRGVN